MNAALLRLILAQVCIHGTMTGMRMATPLLALKEGYSAAAVGMLLALFALTQVFLSLPAGRYADRHGLKRPLIISVVAACSGAGVAVLFPIYPVLCLSALLTGGAAGMALIALQRHVGRMAHNKDELRKVFSWLAIGPAISNFLGPFAAGLLIDYAGGEAASTTGFRAAFLLLTLMPLAAWFWARTVQELPALQTESANQKATAWDLVQNRGFRRLLLLNWALSSCWDVHTFVVPILGHERGLPASVIGSILGAFAIAAAVIRMLMPIITRRLAESQVVLGAMVAACALFIAYPFMPGAWTMGACSVLLGVVLGSVQPMVMSMIHQITPPERHGEALGLRMMAINGSSVLMPVLFGSLGTVVGVSALFWAVGVLVGVSSRLPWLIGKQDMPADEWGDH
ncbi:MULTISPECIES: MFS transporter [Comamonas]|uniref:MFS transporter n=1 Tax=Comamonas thiooxydans TaxID=363952 RepID=A0A096E917_9BURK|nr:MULTISPECIES: MFS transporter [Comamonas]KGG85557.1 MFS transporter [Comamonas thiooxydans]KGG89936.1 MFS transporter [Comamonas thiooxydans]KGG97439.1 MFS transporter [Comamonas thiooxydans]KGH01262.1 MFS transporter [Comamonas thiooxydans]KGH09896.1 MFS transporter [Comamonas thiooxydans]